MGREPRGELSREMGFAPFSSASFADMSAADFDRDPRGVELREATGGDAILLPSAVRRRLVTLWDTGVSPGVAGAEDTTKEG